MIWKDKLKKYGLKIIGKGYAPPGMLKIRYIPQLFNAKFYPTLYVSDSPHVELMRIFKEYGFSKKHLDKSLYVAERRDRRKKGMESWTEERIWKRHLKNRYRTFASIKKHGYDKDRCETPILVLEEPFWKTRYGWVLDGKEIYNGAGRCASAYVCSIEEVPVVWIKDMKPGKKKSHLDKKLKGVKK